MPSKAFGLNASDIRSLLVDTVTLRGPDHVVFRGFQQIDEAGAEDISWIKPGFTDEQTASLINGSAAGCIVCNETAHLLFTGKEATKLFIITDRPQHSFYSLLSHYERFISESAGHAQSAVDPNIHPTAVVHPDATLGPGVHIGAYSVIDACTIGANTIIGEYVRIFSPVNIGAGCHVREFCSIGGAGFGIIRDEDGNNVQVPHVGRVEVGDGVIVLPFSNLDRATLGTTFIGHHTAIDHYCHIGHNCKTGSNNIITAKTVMSGGSKIGNDCFIGVNTVIKQKVSVGSSVTTGMGTIVTKNIPDNETWVGNPAQPLAESKKDRSFLKAKTGGQKDL